MEQVHLCSVAVSAGTYAMDKPYTYLVPPELETVLTVGMRVLVPFGQGSRTVEGLVLAVTMGERNLRLKTVQSLLDERPVLNGEGVRLAMWMRERYFCTVWDNAKAMLPAGLYYSMKDTYRLAPGVTREDALALVGKAPNQRSVLELLFEAGGSIQREALYAAFGSQSPAESVRALRGKGVLMVDTSTARNIGDKTEQIAMLAIPEEEALERLKPTARAQRGVVRFLAESGSAAVKEVCYFTGTAAKTVKTLASVGIITLFQREVYRRAERDEVAQAPEPTLNQEQQAAYDGICRLTDAQAPACALLYGVTGSGKTQVYLKLIHHVLSLGKTALMLVPEIALTPQMLRQFEAQFGQQVAVLHSSLSAGARYDEWKLVRSGQAKVVVGTRSAVFAPLERLGILILDEEQESSYKSDRAPRYHARDIAKYRCAQSGAVLLLGSATPSVETMYYAKQGVYCRFDLKQRYNRHAMPEVVIADLKKELRAGNDTSFSGELRDALAENLHRGEQSILFLNRRGTSRMLVCAECGEAPECPHCSVKLTYHRANERLMCHYCGYSQPLMHHCPDCGGALIFMGAGTQKAQEELERLFPGTKVQRMDADTVSATNSHKSILSRFEQENIPVLLGTQMVAKGLDFENVTLVGALDADVSLYADSYRAGERTFSLLTQVVGRAGRGNKCGRAIIQTCSPQNEIITCAARQDYDSFYENEILLRQLRGFPPFQDIYVLQFSSRSEAAALRSSSRLKDALIAWQKSAQMQDTPFEVLGPAAASVAKVMEKYRYRLTVSCHDCKKMRQMLAFLYKTFQQDKENKGISVSIDLNPMDG